MSYDVAAFQRSLNIWPSIVEYDDGVCAGLASARRVVLAVLRFVWCRLNDWRTGLSAVVLHLLSSVRSHITARVCMCVTVRAATKRWLATDSAVAQLACPAGRVV
jgi:hypothetical protein